jgi:hypothetical protein
LGSFGERSGCKVERERSGCKVGIWGSGLGCLSALPPRS